MNRRSVLVSNFWTGLGLVLTPRAFSAPKAESCVLHADELITQSTGFTRYEHYHIYTLPLAVLISPPSAGYKVRTSSLDPDSLDTAAFEEFLKEMEETLRPALESVGLLKEKK